MRMTRYGCLLMIALLCHPSVSRGNEQSHRKAAENLLIVMEVDKSLPKVVEQVVENHMQQTPQLAPQREVLQRFRRRREKERQKDARGLTAVRAPSTVRDVRTECSAGRKVRRARRLD